MRMIAVLVLLLMVYLAADKPYQVCIVAFYNLENLYDTVDNALVNDDEFTPAGAKKYTSAIYRDKLQKLATVISRIGRDISPDGPVLLGVAEIENDTVLQDLVQHPLLHARRYQVIHFDSKDARGVDVGLLYQAVYFRPVYAARLFVALPGNSKEAAYTRDILYVKGWLSGEMIHLYVNHWPSRRGGQERSAPARAAAASVCRDHARNILHSDPHAKIILMGDLNDDPDSPSIVQVLGAKGNKEEVTPAAWFNPWLEPYQKGLGTLANRDSWGLFDQILLSHAWLNPGDSSYFFHHAAIFAEPFMKEDRGRFRGYPMRTWDGNLYRGGYSDHFPTFVVLAKKARN
ncbi:endonuclease/exonuclease/phosphatase family protein [Sediminibacterium soli]|uniref:endonuclease/exonuclease/phosphatase family protein n=1 Tax=Sediminibacterium soli TaxID=2698829 RepID=UPI00137B4CC0|nr:endonuclease/exonuclease/phosphatase [Sediminibacterium soli]NCI47166.1 endonuclease/exonuclease/phosphatase [Sediminibacterium soli]